jgi:hypothetical protein
MTRINLLTQADYARHRGVSKPAVSKAVRAGRITLTAEGMIDATAADAQWARNSRVRAGAGRSPSTGAAAPPQEDGADAKPGTDDYWASRSRREAAEAELAEIALAEKNNEVIQVKAVDAAWAQAMAAVREHLTQISARVGSTIAAETDPIKVEQMLADEHHNALNLLAMPAALGKPAR